MAKYGPPPIPFEQRFWAKVKKTATCWLWTGHVNGKAGYGMFMRQSPKKLLAHRVSFEMAFGPIPEGAWVLHRCDNPRCVRPDHLFLGDVRSNAEDMMEKGRGKYEAHRGQDNGQAKLDDSQVREMRTRYANGEVTQAQLAQEYSISRALVSFVLTRRYWRHVTC